MFCHVLYNALRAVSPLLTNTIGPPAMVMSVMTMHAGNLSATATKLLIHSSASRGDLALISLTISSNLELRPWTEDQSGTEADRQWRKDRGEKEVEMEIPRD